MATLPGKPSHSLTGTLEEDEEEQIMSKTGHFAFARFLAHYRLFLHLSR